MKLVPLKELFEIELGNKFDLNKMARVDNLRLPAVLFVGRSGKHLGVTARVKKEDDMPPYEAGLITVALGGSILTSSVQMDEFYTAQNVMVLKPLKPMTFEEKVFYCMCIERNQFRYSTYGREANRTLRDLLVPAQPPKWNVEWSAAKPVDPAASIISRKSELGKPGTWRSYDYLELFEIRKGRRLVRRYMKPGSTPCIRPLDANNGYSGSIDVKPDFPGNVITVNYNGNGVAEAYYQEVPFFATDDVNVLLPKFDLTPAKAQFICTLIRKEKYRFNYGRKWNLKRMEKAIVRLPSKGDAPDWDFMEEYIQGLPFSAAMLLKSPHSSEYPVGATARRSRPKRIVPADADLFADRV